MQHFQNFKGFKIFGRFPALRMTLSGAASIAATIALIALGAGATHAQTVNFTGVNLATVSSAAGQTFAVGTGTVNVRLLSGQVDSLQPGSSPDTTGFYALQSDMTRPEVFQFTLSQPQSFTITENETLTSSENNAFSMPSGTWTILSSSNVTTTNSGSTVSFQGTSSSAPYGKFQIQGAGPSFTYTITDTPGFSQYGSALSLKLNGTAAPEPGSIALLALAGLPGIDMVARRRRAAKAA